MPHMPQPEDAAWKQCWQQYGSDQGLIICGHPWDPAISHRPSIPIGNNSYVEAWLAKRDADQQRVERSILDMAHQASPTDHMKHIAWHLLRLMWNTAHTHLWRSLDSRAYHRPVSGHGPENPNLAEWSSPTGGLDWKAKTADLFGGPPRRARYWPTIHISGDSCHQCWTAAQAASLGLTSP